MDPGDCSIALQPQQQGSVYLTRVEVRVCKIIPNRSERYHSDGDEDRQKAWWGRRYLIFEGNPKAKGLAKVGMNALFYPFPRAEASAFLFMLLGRFPCPEHSLFYKLGDPAASGRMGASGAEQESKARGVPLATGAPSGSQSHAS